MVGGTAYSKYTIASLGQTAPGGGKEDNWRLRLKAIGGGENANATFSSVMENADTAFVPQDYSVVLDNSALGIFANLRKENEYITGLDSGPKYATLYVDNAVNITSVTTGDPTTGNAGDPLTLSVTVKNTGRYQDTYSVSANAGSVSTGALAAGSSATKSVPATYPSSTQAILVTAAGDYAKDEDSSLVLTGVQSIVFRAYDTGYASDTALGIAPWKLYGLNDNAPIMVAKKIGAGAVVAASLDGGASYYGSASYPSADNMDILLDITFQWMVPGATKILWYEGDLVFSGYKNTDADVKKMLDNLRAGDNPSGNSYTIDNGNMLRLDNLGLYTTYDILVINQEQMGTDGGKLGGDPSLLWDNELLAIKNWVNGGKGVIVQEVSDYLNYDYNRVSNRILDNLGFGWWFQHDTINDATHNDLAASYKPLVVRVVGNPIGDNYAAQTGRENILAYKCPTLVMAPTVSATVDVPNTSATEGTSGVIVQVTITNNSTVWDNFSLSVSDNKGWTSTANLSENMIRLDNGASKTENLTVNIPAGTRGQVDNVTVNARSFDSGLTFTRSGTVTSLTGPVDLYDENDNWENGYSNIQPAIDAASAGFKITVRLGTYKENLYVNKKNLTIQSTDGAGVTIINAGGVENGVKIVENGVTFKGFTVENADNGIYLEDCSNTTIENNLIDNNGHGIYIDGAASSAVIRFNDITNNTGGDSGIHVESGVDATRIVVNYNNIVGNSTIAGSYGVYNGGTGKLNARFNWWNAASGPGGVGPGAGDNVGENVDYTPWLLKPFENVIVNSTFKNVSAPSDNVELEGVAEVSMDLKENGMVSTTVIKDFSGASIPEGLLKTGFFVDISTVPENIAENIWITLHYTDADVAGIDESSLKLYYWSTTDNSWHLCENITVDTVANTVKGWVNHLTPFGMFGAPIPSLPPVAPPAAGVQVSISPSSKSGTPGVELTYTVTVMNTGGATDTFDLRFSGGAGWSPSISPNSLTLAAGTPGGATLTVTVPSWVAAGASTTITVTATSRADPSVSNSASCSATVSGLPAGLGVTPTPTEATWPAILVIAAAIVIIILSLSFILL
jgi:parallel beta-helix repeat protein